MNNTMKRLTSIYVIRNSGKRKVEVLLELAGHCRGTSTGEAFLELVGELARGADRCTCSYTFFLTLYLELAGERLCWSWLV